MELNDTKLDLKSSRDCTFKIITLLSLHCYITTRDFLTGSECQPGTDLILSEKVKKV